MLLDPEILENIASPFGTNVLCGDILETTTGKELLEVIKADENSPTVPDAPQIPNEAAGGLQVLSWVTESGEEMQAYLTVAPEDATQQMHSDSTAVATQEPATSTHLDADDCSLTDVDCNHLVQVEVKVEEDVDVEATEAIDEPTWSETRLAAAVGADANVKVSKQNDNQELLLQHETASNIRCENLSPSDVVQLPADVINDVETDELAGLPFLDLGQPPACPLLTSHERTPPKLETTASGMYFMLM